MTEQVNIEEFAMVQQTFVIGVKRFLAIIQEECKRGGGWGDTYKELDGLFKAYGQLLRFRLAIPVAAQKASSDLLPELDYQRDELLAEMNTFINKSL